MNCNYTKYRLDKHKIHAKVYTDARYIGYMYIYIINQLEVPR